MNTSKRLILLYLIDSLIKNFEGRFINLFAPDIVHLFSEAYSVADFETRINLFKLYYSWKFFFDSKILSELNAKYDLDEMKRKIQETHPDIIERYDKFNWEQEQKRLLIANQEKSRAEDDNTGNNLNIGNPSGNVLLHKNPIVNTNTNMNMK